MPIFQTEVSFRNPGFFRGTDALSVGFKMKPLGQGDVPVKTKTNSNLAIKFVEMRKGKKVKSPCSNTCILSWIIKLYNFNSMVV